MQKILITSLLLGLPLLSGCSDYSLPEIPDLPDGVPEVVHKIEIQQGNIVDQDMINKLRPGMGKRQVRFIMGSPMILDTFHENRWIYVYRLHRSQHEATKKMHLSLFFENEKLARIEGDMRPLPDKTVEKKTEVVEVPIQERKVGVFDRVLGTVGVELEDE